MMGQITRHHSGPVAIDVRLLEEIEELLAVDLAEPRAVIAPLADRFRALWVTGDFIAAEAVEHEVEPHDWLRLLDVDAIQRLRGWHRLRRGSIVVEARWLSEVRNLLDVMTINGCSECEDELERLADYLPEDDPLRVKVAAAVKEGRPCGECEWDRALDLRDRCDAALDAAGYVGNIYYRTYVLGEVTA